MTREWKYPPFEIINAFKENTDEFSVTYSQFFGTFLLRYKYGTYMGQETIEIDNESQTP